MRIPNRETIEKLRARYPEGCRVELIKMDDLQAPPPGTKGTVKGVDDIGSIMVSWDNGSHLSVAFGADIVRRLESVTTICYGKKGVWDSRNEAKEFFKRGIAECDGSEQERYEIIYSKLLSGLEICTDELDD